MSGRATRRGFAIRLWHQRAFEAKELSDFDQTTADLVVAVCRELRRAGHPMNAADGKEVLRMARDLASLRNFAAPGRGELIEAIQTCLGAAKSWALAGRWPRRWSTSWSVPSKAICLPPSRVRAWVRKWNRCLMR